MTEYWDLFDLDGNFVDKKIARGTPIPEQLFHRVVHIWILNEREEYLIQRRARNLKWFGGRWSTTTGSVQSGQYDYKMEAYREVEEELGLDSSQIDIEYEKDIIISNSIVSIFKAYLPSYIIQHIQINDELEEVKWMKKGKIIELRGQEEFVPYSEELFHLVFNIKFL